MRRRDVASYVPLGLKGKSNIVLLLFVIVIVLFSGPLGRAGEAVHFPFLRELALLVVTLLSVKWGPRGPRAANGFHWNPMIEVAVVFAGIFATMIPALALLQAKGAELGLSRPWQYFWATGALSAFLDNAPTYLSFCSIVQGQVGAASIGALTGTQLLPALGVAPANFLAAISCGAVMMGALTYVGNAPNFMVRSLAESAGVRMPHFAAYLGYAAAVLLPVFAIVTVAFF
ncbi:MAG: sodium:proton antiporter, partial [Thermoleophilia bacterium]|nr:sodium:proton antiporter [Thermoleophilia bacterium]